MKKFWMVYRVDGIGPGQRHNTKESACKEADRLAAKQPGDVFVVLEAIEKFSAYKPKVFREVLEDGTL